jgi:hypothetical protein
LPKNVPATERLFYREVAMYTDQIDRYLKAFGCDNVKVIIYDDFKKDPARICCETFEFLNVDAGVEPQIGIVNPNKKVRSKVAQSTLDRPPSLLGKLVRPLTTPSLRHRLFVTAQDWNTSYAPRLPLADEITRQLRQEFAPEIERLSILLNRDLTCWSRS